MDRVGCSYPECSDARANLGRESPATRFFRSTKALVPFYFGRCERHARPEVLNMDLVEELPWADWVCGQVLDA